MSGVSAPFANRFQSTRPVQGATYFRVVLWNLIYISIHAPRAGRDRVKNKIIRETRKISIHAPRAGRDSCPCAVNLTTTEFQSTRPVQGATQVDEVDGLVRSISIHAPRAGRDTAQKSQTEELKEFQSTRPVQGATGLVGVVSDYHSISIHAPRAGRDLLQGSDAGRAGGFQSTRPVQGATPGLWVRSGSPTNFNPRAPCRARLKRFYDEILAALISIHAPRAGRDRLSIMFIMRDSRFQSTRPVQGATRSRSLSPTTWIFQSTRPVQGATLRIWAFV